MTVVHEYKQEKVEDDMLKEIKNICFAYLAETEFTDSISDKDLNLMHEFLEDKFYDILETKNALEIENYSWPISETAQLLHEYALIKDWNETTELMSTRIRRSVTTALEQIGFCHGIIKKIMKEREENDH